MRDRHKIDWDSLLDFTVPNPNISPKTLYDPVFHSDHLLVKQLLQKKKEKIIILLYGKSDKSHMEASENMKKLNKTQIILGFIYVRPLPLNKIASLVANFSS